MTDEQFKVCSKEVLLEGAKASFANAQSHFRVAEASASIGEYGIGNSLLILSVEECVKSMILTAGFLGIEIPFDVSPFFRDHKTKHGQAAEIQPLLNEVWRLKDIFIDFLKSKRSVFDTVIGLTLTWVFTSIGFKDKPLKDFTEWWRQANTQKNNGFYVGFNGTAWRSPITIDKGTYEETLSLAKPFVECLEVVNYLKLQDLELFSQKRPLPCNSSLKSYEQ